MEGYVESPQHFEGLEKNIMPGIEREQLKVGSMVYDLLKPSAIRDEGREVATLLQNSPRKYAECLDLYEQLATCFDEMRGALDKDRPALMRGYVATAQNLAHQIQHKYSRVTIVSKNNL